MEPDTERAAESHAAAALVHADKIQRVNHQSEFGVAVPPQGADGVGPNQAPDWDILNCRMERGRTLLPRRGIRAQRELGGLPVAANPDGVRALPQSA